MEEERDLQTVLIGADNTLFIRQALQDLSLRDTESLKDRLSKNFSGLYDENLSINGNLKNIAVNIRTRQAQGSEITNFEKIILSIADKVETQIDKISNEEKKEALKKYGTYAAIGLGLYFLLKR